MDGRATNPTDTNFNSESLLSPILKLNPDIFRRISEFVLTDYGLEESFTMMVPTLQHPYVFIHTLRQVCKAWDQLICESPLLWGRVIYLDILDSLPIAITKPPVLGTTSKIWVKGAIKRFPPSRGSWDELVKDCWPNVQRLSIQFITETTLATLQQPTDVLESCIIHDHPSDDAIQYKLQNLFDGGPKFGSHDRPRNPSVYCPRLRRFSCAFHFVGLQEPWFTQLTTLEIAQSYRRLPASYTLANWLMRLADMSNLQDLVFTDAFLQPDRMEINQLPRIQLPALRSLRIGHSLFSSAIFMRQINIEESKFLEDVFIKASYSTDLNDDLRTHDDDLGWISTLLSRYSSILFKMNMNAISSTETYLKFTTCSNYLKLSISPKETSSQKYSFALDLSIMNPFMEELPDISLFSPSNPLFASASSLILEAYPFELFGASQRRSAYIHDVSQAFISVRTLITNPPTLQYLLESDKISLDIFPLLQVLKFVRSKHDEEDKKIAYILDRFLKPRKNAGIASPVIDLGPFDSITP